MDGASRPHPRLVFPDTTAIINFALADEMALLEHLVGDNGSWSAAVAGECDDQAEKWNLPNMARAHTIFGEPRRLVTPSEYIDYQAHLTFFREASSTVEASHRGESETLAILTANSIKSLVVSDDVAVARRLGGLDVHPTIQATTSWHLLRVACWKGYITVERFWEIRRILLSHNRGCPRDVRDRESFALWVEKL